WPSGFVEEFDSDESYFHEICTQFELDLRGMSGASRVWQTVDAARTECAGTRTRTKRYPPTPNGTRITSSSCRQTVTNSALKTKRSEKIRKTEPKPRILGKAVSAFR